MDKNIIKSKDIVFFDSESMFRNSIPFKIYKIGHDSCSVGKHFHDYMQIWYVSRGVFNHWINNREQKMVKGDIFVLPPYIVHKVRPIEGEDIKIIGCEFSPRFINSKFEDFNNNKDLFDFAYLEPFLVSEDLLRPKLNLTGAVQITVENVMKDMLNEYSAKDKYYDILIKAHLLKLLGIIAREYGKSNENTESREIFDKYRSAITDSIQYIHNRFNEEIHLDELCKHAMMSKTYFCYIFKSLTGKTFTEYLIDIRIRKALDYLINKDTPITQICYEVGFNDITYFYRTFKKITGVSPKYYRKTAWEKENNQFW